MRKNDAQLGRPFIDFRDTQANIEALTGLIGGEQAHATDTGKNGYYDAVGAAWVWAPVKVFRNEAFAPDAVAGVNGYMTGAYASKLDGIAPGANLYVHPNHSGDVTSAGDGAQTIVNNAVTNAKAADMANNSIKGRVVAGTGDPQDLTPAEGRTVLGVSARSEQFRNNIFAQFISPMLEALVWAAAQIYQAAVTFQSTISQAVTSSSAGSTFNQSGTGDIAAFQDAGVSTVRVLDQGGIALIPQAGGFQNVAGLLGYDSIKKRMVLYHESHNYPVPVDPRNGFRNINISTTY